MQRLTTTASKNVGRKVTRQQVTGLGYMQLDYITLEVLTEGLNMYQKASTCDRRSQLIIITGSVVLLASIVSILEVRSNLSIKFYHPTTSLSRNLFVMLCQEIAEIARRNTQNELVAAQEKSDFSFNFNCFSQRKAGTVYIFISEGNSIMLRPSRLPSVKMSKYF